MAVSPYQTMSVRFGGGLNLTDAPEAVKDHEAYELQNFQLQGIGRITTRKALRAIGTTLSGKVCGIFGFPFGTDVSGSVQAGVAYIVFLDPGVRVTVADANGQTATVVGTLPNTWATTTVTPKVTAASMNQKLFLVDEDRSHGLAIYDPSLASGKLWQPVFTFDSGSGVIKPRVITIYNNMLFVAGYGTNTDPDRPEMVRFSYLGLVFDSEGAGDAGSGDSAGLFDIDDYFMVGERGTAVVSMVPAAGRLIIGTEKAVYTLFGYDRSSFNLELLDNQRGCVATRAMVEAGGDVYWWSPLGPCRYRSGQVQDIGREITTLLSGVDHTRMFAAHAPEAKEIRFYYSNVSEADEDPNRALVFNYVTDSWSTHKFGTDALPVRLYCAGFVRTSEADPPTAAVSEVTVENVTHDSVEIEVTAGDAAPGVMTLVEAASVTLGAGTVTVTNASATVTGVGTNFSAIAVGGYFMLYDYDGRAYKIAAVGGSTSMTISPVWQSTGDSLESWGYVLPDGFTTALEMPAEGGARYTITGLAPSTTYIAKVYHKRGGTSTEPYAVTFTTNAAPPTSGGTPATTLTAPTRISVASQSSKDGRRNNYLLVNVLPAYHDKEVEVQVSDDDTNWYEFGTTNSIRNSTGSLALFPGTVLTFGTVASESTYYFRARHRDNYGNTSSYTSSVSAVMPGLSII